MISTSNKGKPSCDSSDRRRTLDVKVRLARQVFWPGKPTVTVLQGKTSAATFGGEARLCPSPGSQHVRGWKKRYHCQPRSFLVLAAVLLFSIVAFISSTFGASNHSLSREESGGRSGVQYRGAAAVNTTITSCCQDLQSQSAQSIPAQQLTKPTYLST